MKKPINEIKKMQRLAGLITESEYQESLMNEDFDMEDDDDFDLNAAFEASPMSHSYNDVLNVIEDYEDEDILNNFKAEFSEDEDISRDDYSNFAEEYMDDMSEVDYIKANWISISDPDIYDKAGLNESSLNEAEPNIKKIGKYITIETDKYDEDYPDLDRQAISDYLESVIDPKYIKDVKTFMNDDEEGYEESRSYFFDEDDRYKDPSAVNDSEVEEWAKQEMSYYLFSQPDEFPSKGANKPRVKKASRFPATSPLNKTSPKLLALLDAVEKDWGKDSDLGLDIAVFLITRQDENGELSPANKIAMKKLLSNYKLLNKYGHFLDENIDESPVNESETKTFSAMQPIINDLKDGMVTLDSLMSRDTGENSLQQAAKRQGLKGLSIKMIELWTALSKSI